MNKTCLKVYSALRGPGSGFQPVASGRVRVSPCIETKRSNISRLKFAKCSDLMMYLTTDKHKPKNLQSLGIHPYETSSLRPYKHSHLIFSKLFKKGVNLARILLFHRLDYLLFRRWSIGLWGLGIIDSLRRDWFFFSGCRWGSFVPGHLQTNCLEKRGAALPPKKNVYRGFTLTLTRKPKGVTLAIHKDGKSYPFQHRFVSLRQATRAAHFHINSILEKSAA